MSPCPQVKNKHAFDGVKNPHPPSWNRSATGGVPDWIRTRGNIDRAGCCDEWGSMREDIGYRNRSASGIDLDELLGNIIDGLEARGVLNNTYIFLSGDNGYHLGQHHLLFGKTEPYETDLRVPMWVRGPGVPAGSTRPHPTAHIDITRTIVELAQAEKTSPLEVMDGKSFASVLTTNPPSIADWRPYSFSEFYTMNNTWLAVRRVNETTGEAAEKVIVWCSQQYQVFKLPTDPYELANLASTPEGEQKVKQWLPTMIELSHCKGPEECFKPMPSSKQAEERGVILGRAADNPLPCHKDEFVKNLEYYLDYQW
eukprot:m.69423 g.69423  ORF g.69423 m.69423 type:complete len:312 (+) comp19983_c0_seq1:791-1726(+)